MIKKWANPIEERTGLRDYWSKKVEEGDKVISPIPE